MFKSLESLIGGVPERRSCIPSIYRELSVRSEKDKALMSINNMFYGDRNKKDIIVLKLAWKKLDEIANEERKHSNFISRSWKTDSALSRLRKEWPAIESQGALTVTQHQWYILFARRWVPSENFNPCSIDIDIIVWYATQVFDSIQRGEINLSGFNPYKELARLLEFELPKDI